MSTADHLWQRISEKDYCDPARRMDFVLVFDVKDGNPNGDPDAGNLPRMDPANRHGIVTDVCIKRKVRDYLATVLDRPIFIQSMASLNSLYFDAARKATEYNSEGDKDSDEGARKRRREDKEAVESLHAEVSASDNQDLKVLFSPDESDSGKDSDTPPSFYKYLVSVEIEGLEFDPVCNTVRYLGEAKSKDDFVKLFPEEDRSTYKDPIATLAAALAAKKKSQKGKANERDGRDAVKRRMCEEYDDIRLFGAVLTAGTNAGQIRGPLQLTFARSLEPILQMDAAITRCAITKSADMGRKQTEMGRKAWLGWSAYRLHGFYNPLLAEQTGLTREDLARFWESLACMFPNAASASKGEMATRELVVFAHDHKRGNAPSHRLLEGVVFKRREPAVESPNRVFSEVWDCKIHDSLPLGVTMHRPMNDLWGEGL